MDMFVPEPVRRVVLPLSVRLEQSVATLARLMREGVPVCAAYSGGKDSTCVMLCFFMAAVRVLAEGIRPRLLVLHADTGIENPLIRAVAERELNRMRAYAKKLGFELEVAVSRPKLLDSWAVRILGGRSLPSVPERQGDCSTDWKIEPMARLRKELLPQWGGGREVVTLTGTRFAESAARAAKMTRRGESDLVPVRNKQGELVLSPIAHWSTEDVWELIGEVANGTYTSYTDGVDVLTAYADAGPTSCAVVNDAILEGEPSRSSKCGARFGCMLCMQIREDASMNAMLEKPEYEFLRGVAQLRQYLIDTDYDLEERLWIGRTIKEGHIAIRPDVYGPKKLRELFRMACTLDALEIEAARRAHLRGPRFQLVPLEAALAIDALWSLNGHWDGFAALDDWREIHERGARFTVPSVATPFPKVELPEVKFLPVGETWERAAEDRWAGLIDAQRRTLLEDCMTEKFFGKKSPVFAWAETVGDEFEIDMEGACMFLDFEAERYIEQYRPTQDGEGWAYTYRTYLQYGLLQISEHQVASHDEALKRNHWKRIHHLNGPNPDVEAIKARAMSAREVPRRVLEAFLNEGALRKFDERIKQEQREARQGNLF